MNTMNGSSHSCDEAKPPAFLQCTLYAEHTHGTHRSRGNQSDQHPLEDEIQYVYMYRKTHIGGKVTKSREKNQIYLRFSETE